MENINKTFDVTYYVKHNSYFEGNTISGLTKAELDVIVPILNAHYPFNGNGVRIEETRKPFAF